MTNKKEIKQSNLKKKLTKRKVLKGVVVSTKMNNTIVVKVVSQKRHPLYKKIMSSSKKYLAHSEQEVKVGDAVKIQQCRPLSKMKQWKILVK
ncbi:MAG: 30S ribosomal protein S17 [Candidatus Dojkabacteria bacterium]|nr:30S ribosomal protein S17 [Candidatus Dojkabacteria bacterium]